MRHTMVYLLALGALVLGACDAGETRAHVVIDATADVRRTARSLEILVLSGRERRLAARQVYRIPQEREFPAELELRPANVADPGEFTIAVRAYENEEAMGEPVVGRLLVAVYDPGRSVDYRVLLGLEPSELEDGGVNEGGMP